MYVTVHLRTIPLRYRIKAILDSCYTDEEALDRIIATIEDFYSQ